MSTIKELKTKLEAIPHKQSRKDLVGKLEQYGTLAATASQTLVKCREEQRYSRQIFADEGFQKTTEQMRRAIGYATRLGVKLADKIEAVETSDTQFSSLSEAAKIANTALRSRWSDLLTKKIEEFESVIRAAKDANLKGSRPLEQTILRLRTHINFPPQNSADCQRIEQDLNSLVESVQTLGLEGPGGQFLVDASAGRGKAKDLTNPEIADFIERYKLWNSLNVKLG
jgi:hypothetical protein